jgi:hypothetical protein
MYNLGWGDPVVVREALFTCYNRTVNMNDSQFSYACMNHTSEIELNKLVKTLSKQLFNQKYEHIVLTCGATQAINASLAYYKEVKKMTNVKTLKTYFPLYPSIIKSQGLRHNGNQFIRS